MSRSAVPAAAKQQSGECRSAAVQQCCPAVAGATAVGRKDKSVRSDKYFVPLLGDRTDGQAARRMLSRHRSQPPNGQLARTTVAQSRYTSHMKHLNDQAITRPQVPERTSNGDGQAGRQSGAQGQKACQHSGQRICSDADGALQTGPRCAQWQLRMKNSRQHTALGSHAEWTPCPTCPHSLRRGGAARPAAQAATTGCHCACKLGHARREAGHSLHQA